MKTIFYKYLLSASPYSEFTPTQQIIFSFLVSKSVTSNKDLFDTDGQKIKTTDIYEYYQEGNYCVLDLVDMPSSFVSSTLDITPKTYFSTVSLLKGYGFIQNETIRFPPELIKQGYFELLMSVNLPKQLLIFYSWLYNLSQKDDFVIYSHSQYLAEKMNVSKNTIRSMIKSLSDRGLVRRIVNEYGSYGKLIITPF